jgi:hypothetical protein
MRITAAHRQGLSGSDEGLTFDITTAGHKNQGKRILRFDCFYRLRKIIRQLKMSRQKRNLLRCLTNNSQLMPDLDSN